MSPMCLDAASAERESGGGRHSYRPAKRVSVQSAAGFLLIEDGRRALWHVSCRGLLLSMEDGTSSMWCMCPMYKLSVLHLLYVMYVTYVRYVLCVLCVLSVLCMLCMCLQRAAMPGRHLLLLFSATVRVDISPSLHMRTRVGIQWTVLTNASMTLNVNIP